MPIIRNLIYSFLILIITSNGALAIECISQSNASKSESVQSDKSTSNKLGKKKRSIIKRVKRIVKKKGKGDWFWPFGLTGILSVVSGLSGLFFINTLWAIILALTPWFLLAVFAILIYYLFREA